MPVFGTIASTFNDIGVTALYQLINDFNTARASAIGRRRLPRLRSRADPGSGVIVPANRRRYLAEIADTVRGYHKIIAPVR
jgi:isobutyryl-CoA mutase